jgi:carboxylesterase type B
MALKIPLILLTIFFDFCVSSLVSSSPAVNTQQGCVQGTRLTDQVDAFLGIPYAQPPVGPLRFQPPQPLEPKSNTDGVLNASQYGPVCYQFHYRTVAGYSLFPTTPESEDCLTLNIFVPHNRDRGKLLPVFVWSYGGAFGEGGGSVPVYDPTSFVETNKDIIFVSWK